MFAKWKGMVLEGEKYHFQAAKQSVNIDYGKTNKIHSLILPGCLIEIILRNYIWESWHLGPNFDRDDVFLARFVGGHISNDSFFWSQIHRIGVPRCEVEKCLCFCSYVHSCVHLPIHPPFQKMAGNWPPICQEGRVETEVCSWWQREARETRKFGSCKMLEKNLG